MSLSLWWWRSSSKKNWMRIGEGHPVRVGSPRLNRGPRRNPRRIERPHRKGPQWGGTGFPQAHQPPLEPRERRPECTPKRVPPKGGHPFHNTCADNVPFNAFPGANVLVNGKAFDALQPAARTLWEVKTTAIETYSPYVQEAELNKQVKEGRKEQALAAACGYQLVIGVRTQVHKTMLEARAPDLIVVLMPWC